MPTGYLESEAGQQEYANIGIPFPKKITMSYVQDTSAVQLLL
jgi:hypothetical protein